jgi:Mg2+/Co2+ transporter CorB
MVLVFVVLVFAEVAPKTLAAISPEKIAFPASWILSILQIFLAPFVGLVKVFSNGFLRIFGVRVVAKTDALSSEELRAAVRESDDMLDLSHKEMLLRILEMEHITVEDVMVPRANMEAIDLEDDWDEIIEQLATSHHTRVPVFNDSLDNFVGILHIRKVFYLSQMGQLNKESLTQLIREPHFIPENTSITHALTHLQDKRRRFGIVVDEYGDIKGLVTLEQILEEVVGKFTTMVPGVDDEIKPQADGSYLVRGNAYLRDVNRHLDWQLPTDDAKTINGLITEYLEDIPQPNTCFRLGQTMIEIVQTRDSVVQVARLKLLPDSV